MAMLKLVRTTKLSTRFCLSKMDKLRVKYRSKLSTMTTGNPMRTSMLSLLTHPLICAWLEKTPAPVSLFSMMTSLVCLRSKRRKSSSTLLTRENATSGSRESMVPMVRFPLSSRLSLSAAEHSRLEQVSISSRPAAS